jgi:hypothetical protein
MKQIEDTGKARGGLARAARLSPQERAKIARDAARTRWEKHRALKAAGIEPQTQNDKMLDDLADAKADLEFARICVENAAKAVARLERLLHKPT